MRIKIAIKQSQFNTSAQEIIINIMYTSSRIELKISQILKTFNLTLPQYNCLRILKGQKGQFIAASDVSSRMIDASSNTTRIIDRLLKNELVTRETDKEDRRKVLLRITTKGMNLLQKVESHEKKIEGTAEMFSPSKAKKLSALLDEFREIFTGEEK